MPFSSRASNPSTRLAFLVVFAFAVHLCATGPAIAQNTNTDLHQGFLNPPPDARPWMRWWWFGPAVVKPELEKELETMRSVGVGGVEIQPVYPLMLDDPAKGIRNLGYLSPEFLDDVSFANTTGRSLGLRVSLTLGSGWPYGGPRTTIDLAAGKLKVVAVPITSNAVAPPELAEGDRLVAAFQVAGTGQSYDPASARRIDANVDSLLPSSGQQTALFFISSHTRQMVKRAAFGAEGYVLDHFSRAAIDEHLKDVAASLLNAFGSEPPYSCFSDSLEVYGSDWTAQLPAEFQKRRGYDLISHLPELWAGGTPQAEAVRHDWGQTLSDLIRENYLSPLTQFAEAHRSLFRSQTYGEPAVTLADESIPNLPEGEGPQWRSFSFTRWASSASHLYNRNVTSAETWTWLHSPAFRATPLDMKAEADRMFLEGVNQFVGHGWPYSPPAAGEPGWSLYAAAVFNSHNPWFPVMPDITKYLQRVSWVLRQGKPANDIAILLPEDDAQAAFAPGHVSVTDEMKKRISPQLMSAVLDAGYNIDYIDAATINKLSAIPYPVLVIPPTDRIPLAAYRKIESYAAGSGRVMAIGKAPSIAPGLIDQEDSAEIASLSQRLFKDNGHAGVLVDSVEQLPEALHTALPPDLDAAGQIAGLGFIHRRLPDSDIYYVVNTSNAEMDGRIQFRSQRAFLESWEPDSGRILSRAPHGEGKPVTLLLAPYESRVFVLRDHAGPLPATAGTASQFNESRAKQIADLNTGWQIRFADSRASQSLASLTSWTDLHGRQFYSGEAVYTHTFLINTTPAQGTHYFLDFGLGTPTADNRPAGSNGMHALLDPPIREAAIVFINGRRAGSLWHPPYRLDISGFVRHGQNRAEVRVYNTAINLLAGQPPRDYSALSAKYGERFVPQDMDNLQPIPSGLFGPVRLLEEAAK